MADPPTLSGFEIGFPFLQDAYTFSVVCKLSCVQLEDNNKTSIIE